VPIIPKNEYDFVLSCNNLEHIANPLKAIKNWLTLLKNEGTIVLILPRKESNFDHKRPTTIFEHLKNDFDNNIGEDDLTCLNEVLQLHNLKFDPLAGSFEKFKTRGLNNFNNRCLHHHVFDKKLLEEICHFFGLQILLSTQRVDNYIIVAKK
jgi:SAM-dependent methyltransferase